MKTPKEVLQEYLDGIDDVLDGIVPTDDIIEVKRQRQMFLQSIHWIDYMGKLPQKTGAKIGRYYPKKKRILINK